MIDFSDIKETRAIASVITDDRRCTTSTTLLETQVLDVATGTRLVVGQLVELKLISGEFNNSLPAIVTAVEDNALAGSTIYQINIIAADATRALLPTTLNSSQLVDYLNVVFTDDAFNALTDMIVLSKFGYSTIESLKTSLKIDHLFGLKISDEGVASFNSRL